MRSERPPSGSDARLARRLKQRDERALEEIYARYGGTTLRYLAHLTGDHAIAEDVLQQVFVEVWRRGESYDPERAGLLTWIMQIARSRAIDQLRKRVPEPVDPHGRLATELVPDHESSLDALTAQWQLAHYLQQLPEDQASLLRMRFVDDMSQREIAAACGRHPDRNREDADGEGHAPAARVDGSRRDGRTMKHEDEMRRDDQMIDFLLDELSADERDEFEAAIDVDVSLADELAGLGTVVALLEGAPDAIWDEGETVSLPDLDLAAIVAVEARQHMSLNGARPRGESDRRRGRFARLTDMLGARPALAGALTALIFVLGAGVGLLAAGDDGVPRLHGDAAPTLVLQAVSPAGGEAAGKMWWDRPTRTMRFEFDGLERLPRGEYYETWMSKGDDGDDEVSLGAFVTNADGSASLNTPAPVDPAKYARIEVTRERADGNPASSGIVVLGARLTSATRRAIGDAIGTDGGAPGDSVDTPRSRAGDRSSGDKHQSDRGGGGGGDADGAAPGGQSPGPQAGQPGGGDSGSGTSDQTNPPDEPGGPVTEPVPPLLPLPLPPLPQLSLPEQSVVNDHLVDSLNDPIERLPRLGQTDR